MDLFVVFCPCGKVIPFEKAVFLDGISRSGFRRYRGLLG